MYSNSDNAVARSAVTIPQLRKMKAAGEKIAMLTAYDASFAALLDRCGVDVVLVGDSLGMVIQGHDNTLPVTVADIAYHSAAVARGLHSALLIADLPFLSYATVESALASCSQLMGVGRAAMVKLEGAGYAVEIVRALADRDIPVCAHIGLTPQSVHKLGGYRVQGRDAQAAERMFADAQSLEQAGADMLVLECVPADLAERITRSIAIPTIGIGAGKACDGQVLVLHDLLGVTAGKRPRFVKDFLAGSSSVEGAIRAFTAAVKAGEFPGPEHSY